MENGRVNVGADIQESRFGRGLTRKFHGERASETWAPEGNSIRIRGTGKKRNMEQSLLNTGTRNHIIKGILEMQVI